MSRDKAPPFCDEKIKAMIGSGTSTDEELATPPMNPVDGRSYVARYRGEKLEPVMVVREDTATLPPRSVSYGTVEDWHSDDWKEDLSLVEVRFSRDAAAQIMLNVVPKGTKGTKDARNEPGHNLAGPDLYRLVDKATHRKIYMTVRQPVVQKGVVVVQPVYDHRGAPATDSTEIVCKLDVEVARNNLAEHALKIWSKHTHSDWKVTNKRCIAEWWTPDPPSSPRPTSA